MQKSAKLAMAGLLFLSGISEANQYEKTQRNWLRLDSAHFILYAADDASGAVNAIEQLEATRAFVQSSLKIGHIPNLQVTVFVFNGGQAFVPYEPHPNTFAFYRLHRGRNYIIVKSTHGGPRRALAHEYIHAAIANVAPKIPIWLAEGLAEVYSEARKNGEMMSFGLAITDHIARVNTMPPGTVRKIFTATAESVYADPSKVWDFYALSWAAVHCLITEPKYSGKLAEFVAATNAIGTEHALHSIYGVSTAEFAGEVERHTKDVSWEQSRLAFAWKAATVYSIVAVPESKVLAVLADALRVDRPEGARIDSRRREQASWMAISSTDPY